MGENRSLSNGQEGNVPKLRFPGFEGEWGVALLSEIFEKNTQKNADGKITNVICNSAKQGLIPQREYFDKDIANGDNTNAYYIIKQNDFVYNPRKSSDAPYGPISIYKYADAGIVSPLYLCFSAKHRINSRYFEWYFRSPVWHRYIYISGDSGARHDRVSIKDSTFFAMPICIPSGHEQMQIASFLSKLDERIEKQRLLVENIKKYKRGLLSAIFPEKDKATPMYRLSEFTEPWEQRKAVDIAEYSKGNGYSKSDLTESGTPIILYGRLYTKYQFVINEVDTFAIPKASAVYSQGNEVIIPASGETAEDIARASAVEKPGVLLGGDLNILRPFDFINPSFLALAISSGEPQKELEKKAQGKSVVHIHNSDIQEIIISYPARIEQDQIVAFFRRLDRLITLHQRELELFTKYKLGLLQQLFI